ncbi:MAG: hypothetical protein RTU92_06510 [Candidatus Thorarchaeota archaeon]
MSGLSGDYLSLLIALQEEPFANISDLVERVKASKPTVIKKLKYLRENRAYYVQPILDYHSLGYQAVDVLLDTKHLSDVKRLEDIATNHPYTAYRSRCFGSHNGLFLQFRAPTGTKPLIEEMVKTLTDEGVVSRAQFLTTGDEPTIISSMRIDGWHADSMTWKFDWKSWFESKSELKKYEAPTGTAGSVLEWITKKDLFILQQLMLNSRRHNAEMIRSLEQKGIPLTPQTFGRRLKMIDEHCVTRYRVGFDPIAFDIITNVLITGEGKKSYLQNLFSKMSDNPVPFASTMRVSDTSLFWYVRMPPSHLSSLLSNLHTNLEGINVTLIDYTQSFVYSIWPEILDEANKAWRTDREFMIDQVLK